MQQAQTLVNGESMEFLAYVEKTVLTQVAEQKQTLRICLFPVGETSSGYKVFQIRDYSGGYFRVINSLSGKPSYEGDTFGPQRSFRTGDEFLQVFIPIRRPLKRLQTPVVKLAGVFLKSGSRWTCPKLQITAA